MKSRFGNGMRKKQNLNEGEKQTSCSKIEKSILIFKCKDFLFVGFLETIRRALVVLKSFNCAQILKKSFKNGFSVVDYVNKVNNLIDSFYIACYEKNGHLFGIGKFCEKLFQKRFDLLQNLADSNLGGHYFTESVR